MSEVAARQAADRRMRSEAAVATAVADTGGATARARLPYAVLCTTIGLVVGWLPIVVHGPIPEKYNVLYIHGAIAVWGWYTARLLIGFLVGITRWPPRWYVRGPLIGFMTMFPLSLVSLATPACGAPCMCLNLITAATIGGVVAGTAYSITGLHRGP